MNHNQILKKSLKWWTRKFQTKEH